MMKSFELKHIHKRDLENVQCRCAWLGCDASYTFGNMPAGWSHIIMYWAKVPEPNLMKVPPGNFYRDGVLCPKHVATLRNQLEDIGILGPMPPMPPEGNA